jgi:predicted acyltransferase (DUF342 family)
MYSTLLVILTTYLVTGTVSGNVGTFDDIVKLFNESSNDIEVDISSTSDTYIETAGQPTTHVHQITVTHLVSHRTSVISTVGCTNMSNVKANVMYIGDICSSEAFSSGENSTILGNISAVDDISLGANTIVNGSIHAGGAITLGNNCTVSGATISDIDNVTVAGAGGGRVGTTAGTPSACVDITNIAANTLFTGDICSSAAFTSGANSQITGNVQAMAAITLGASSTVSGNIHAAAAITLGANSHVAGSAVSDIGTITYGAGATVGVSAVPVADCADFTNVIASTTYIGNICSSAAVTIGASAIVNGNISAVAAITLGASVQLTGNLQAGAAITTGAGATVSGNIHAAAAITLGANSHISGTAVSDIGTITYGAGATVGSV